VELREDRRCFCTPIIFDSDIEATVGHRGGIMNISCVGLGVVGIDDGADVRVE